MSKPFKYTMPSRVVDIFDGLEDLLNFCRMAGYKFNPLDLNNNKAYVWQQFSKYTAGKNFKDQWHEDAIKFGRKI